MNFSGLSTASTLQFTLLGPVAVARWCSRFAMPHSAPVNEKTKRKRRITLTKVSEESHLISTFSRLTISPPRPSILSVSRSSKVDAYSTFPFSSQQMEVEDHTPEAQRNRMVELARYRIGLRERSLYYRLLNKQFVDSNNENEDHIM